MKKKRAPLFSNMILCLLIAGILLPAATLLIWIFTERWAWPKLIPQVFSIRAVLEVAGRKRELLQILGSSILISGVTAVLSGVIGLMTARAMILYCFPGKRLMYFFTILPFMVPATVFAMGIQITFIKMGLNNRISGIIIAHLISSLPYAVRLIMEGTQAVGKRLEEQARVLGASPFQAFYKVSLPVLMPVILPAISMSYVVSFSQYFLTLMIGGGRVKTFTIVMVPYLQSGDRNIASIYSGVFLGVTLAVFAVLEGAAGRYMKRGEGEFYTSE
ncbi:MAG: ABC transporter permease subunit [Lacrimispora sp.]|uniref:ABC transporter permease n=1 Tax=Lacrimispora sp. TaxID=2719234 RepID=UPI0039E4D341